MLAVLSLLSSLRAVSAAKSAALVATTTTAHSSTSHAANTACHANSRSTPRLARRLVLDRLRRRLPHQWQLAVVRVGARLLG